MRPLIVVVALLAGAVPAIAAPVLWDVGSGGNGHLYDVVSAGTGISWDNANAAANAAGGTLATITSSAENDFVFALTDSSTYWWTFNAAGVGPWLGGFQPAGSQEPAGNWQWVTAESFGFTSWAAGQPDNFNPGEDKLAYWGNSGRAATWNDLPTNGAVLPTSYVIEFPTAAAIPEPATVWLLGLGVIGLVRRRR